MDEPALARVEQQRLELEANIAKLKKSLRHWQTLEIEYEGLKEEFEVLPSHASAENCLKAVEDFGAELVDEKELRSLVQDRGRNRNPSQIVEILAKRVEYVTRNVATVRKQVSDAERKRNALLLAEDSGHRDDAALPLTEITEELDEDGHVISAKVETSDSTVPQLVDVLKKAGVTDVVESRGMITTGERSAQTSNTVQSGPSDVIKESFDNDPSKDQTLMKTTASSQILASPPKLEEEKSVATNPNDTAEEAVLRQEMIDYGLNEVGTIVAELDLAEDGAALSYDEDEDEDFLLGSDLDDNDYDDYDEDDSESDDEKGMSKRSGISEKYKQKMEELQKKLGINGLQNLGPSPDLPTGVAEQLDRPPAAEAARKAAIARAEAVEKSQMDRVTPESSTKLSKKKKKKVAFSNELDIAPETTSAGGPVKTNIADTSSPAGAPMSETIVERSRQTVPGQASSANPTKKVSRFKAAKLQEDTATSNTSSTTNSPNATKIVSDTLIERPTPSNSSRPPQPSDVDDAMDRRQLATEYHKLRNKVIQQQGGFVSAGEEDNYGEATALLPVEDEETGKVKKVSRFKAARIK